MKVFRKILISFVFMVMAFPCSAFALDYSNIEAYGVDTIAGFGTVISSSQTFAESLVVFHIVKPDKTKLDVDVKAGRDGVAHLSLFDYHSKVAGKYFVSAKLKESKDFSDATSFIVFPDELSLSNSVVSANKTVVTADLNDSAYVSVILKDQYGNAISNHHVKIISSRNTDKISLVSSKDVTDDFGSIVFKIVSRESGVSVISAVDVNSGKVIDSRLKIAFLNGEATTSSGGSFIPVAYASGAGSVYSFDISGISNFVKAQESLNFTVTAMDKDGVKVDNYTGTVHFYANGDNSSDVVFPEDYTFKSGDAGSHEFSLGLKFIADGSYDIFVSDSGIVIATPKAGSYSDDVLAVTGTAKPLAMLKIFSDNSEVGSVQVDSSGAFSYDTPKLSDGEHSLYVAMADSSGAVVASSEPVKVVVDTTAPVVDQIDIEPLTAVKGGETVHVKVYSEEGVSSAAVLFNSDIVNLHPSLEESGVYIGDLVAPLKVGEYFIDVILADPLDNEGTYVKQASVKVENDIVDGDDNGDVVKEVNVPPSKVVGIVVYGSSHRATLVWDAANDDDGVVKFYKILYGTSPTDLSNVVDTKDASTTWYIPDLVNGSTYYFSVYAVDDKGMQSVEGSQIVNVIPFTLEVESNVKSIPSGPLDSSKDVVLRKSAIEDNTPVSLVDNGPSVYFFLFLSIIIAGVYFVFGVLKKEFLG